MDDRILHGNEPEQLIKLYPKKYKRIMKLINSL